MGSREWGAAKFRNCFPLPTPHSPLPTPDQLPIGDLTLAEHATHVEGLAHHFVSMEQQKEAGMVGMWLFLLTEVMFFGGLFLAYTIYRTIYPEGFLYGSHLLNVPLGGTNTVVLIVSSLTMAMAVYYSQKGERKKLIAFLG